MFSPPPSPPCDAGIVQREKGIRQRIYGHWTFYTPYSRPRALLKLLQHLLQKMLIFASIHHTGETRTAFLKKKQAQAITGYQTKTIFENIELSKNGKYRIALEKLQCDKMHFRCKKRLKRSHRNIWKGVVAIFGQEIGSKLAKSPNLWKE